MNPSYNFSGQVAFVTGASQGMGLATAKAYAVAGAAVVLTDIREDDVMAEAERIANTGAKAIGLVCDVSDEDQVALAVETAVSTYGRLDMAFNNAGVQAPAVDLADQFAVDFDRVYSINLRGIWASMKHELKQMRAQGSGAIVNMASAGGLVAQVDLAAYNATKHGVVGMTKSAALRYARLGIRINAVCPSTINTPMVASMLDAAASDGRHHAASGHQPPWGTRRSRCRCHVVVEFRSEFRSRCRAACRWWLHSQLDKPKTTGRGGQAFTVGGARPFSQIKEIPMTSDSPSTSAVSGLAVTYSGRGGYDVVGVTERSVRAPKSGEVRIRVAAAAVNPTDILLREPGYGNVLPPMTPGMDAAGVIEALGDGLTGLSVGDEVMAAVTPVRPEGGAQATYVVLPVASVVAKPSNVTLAEAATIPMNGLTALYALDHASLTAGQIFAVTGGAGWLAYQAIVLAKRAGLRVVADAKRDDFELVRSYGADVVVERGPGFASAIRTEVPDGVDALLDTALLAGKTFPAIKDGGIYIPVRGSIDDPSERGIVIRPVLVNEVLQRTDWLDTLRQLVESGTLQPRIASVFPPEQVAEAQRFLLSGGVRGRPVLLFSNH